MPKHSLLALAVAAALGGAGTHSFAGQLVMDGIPASQTDAEKRDVPSSDAAKINGIWATTGFTTLLRSNDKLPRCDQPTVTEWPYGQLVDKDGAVLMRPGTSTPWVSNDNDFNSLVRGGDGQLYLISHFEARPGAMYQTRLRQEADGTLVAECTNPIDFSAVKGGWVHCAGSVTPWGNHLGSEEYEPDARSWLQGATVSEYNAQFSRYFGGDGTSDSAKATMNPYWYGWPVEIAIDAQGRAAPTKHYAMGRLALELGYVMPDRKTVYLTDDGTNVGLYLFIADTAGDLSAGKLYAGKWNQVEDNAKGGKATLTWVALGHADRNTVAAALNLEGTGTALTFADLFEVGTLNNPDNGACPDGFTSINKGHEKADGGTTYHECLKVKDGVSEAVVSRLETRRYAALKGATTEWRKMEGITFNPERQTLYLALSEINNGMLARNPTSPTDAAHVGGNDHIRVARNNCGAVYAMRVGGRVRDTNGAVIDSQYVARTMEGLVAGRPITGDAANNCALDAIANPDNLSYLPKYNALVIGEDSTDGHQNDAVWAYDLNTAALTRIQSTPYGSETTSVYWYENLGGHGYLMSVVQHPFGEPDKTTGNTEGTYQPDPEEKWAYTGYFRFPSLK